MNLTQILVTVAGAARAIVALLSPDDYNVALASL